MGGWFGFLEITCIILPKGKEKKIHSLIIKDSFVESSRKMSSEIVKTKLKIKSWAIWRTLNIYETIYYWVWTWCKSVLIK